MNRINTVFAVHNHQPIGNFDSVCEEACERAYRPFLDVLARHPGIKLTQHWSGPLLEWLLRRHPETIERLKELVRSGQLELLTGAYYEAVLAVIPEADRIGQIRKLTGMIERVFGVHPRGMWLAERVWEQGLVRSIVAAGVEYLALDDTHFRHAGLRDDQLHGSYLTEDEGVTLRVFPIDRALRYAVPFRPVDEALHLFQRSASPDGTRLLVNADDGEKFGVWPRTFAHVYDEGWLESFCRMLDEQRSWITTLTLGEAADLLPPLGRVYLPAASYDEMMKWALNAAGFIQLEQFERRLREMQAYEPNAMFVRGASWRNFLAKYPEANHMHKKMLRVARRIRSLESRRPVPQEILDRLWAGQCNDPYWHGVFGGLYLPNLRFPVYRSLLEAEAACDALEGNPGPAVERADFDCDGREELIVESGELNLLFTPAIGGALVELDVKPRAFNLLDILSRREEGYHRRLLVGREEFRSASTVHDGVLTKEEGLEQHLHFDWYRHASLIDHFFGPETACEDVRRCRYLEMGDFVNQPYTAAAAVRDGVVTVVLERHGGLWQGGVRHALTVRKEIRYRPGTGAFTIDYRLTNDERDPCTIRFGVEFQAGLLAGDAHDRYYLLDGRRPEDARLRSSGECAGVRRVELVDEWLGLQTAIEMEQPATVWRCPVETVSLSESGFERLYQSSMVIPHWTLTLEREFSVRLTQSVRVR